MMIRRWRRGLVLAGVGAAIIGGVLLATRPWGGEEVVQEAAAGTITYRLCDTVLEGPIAQPAPEWVAVSRRPAMDGDEPVINVILHSASSRSEVSIDPKTGGVLRELYADSSQETTLQEVLETVRLEPFDSETAGWPYTEVSQLSSEPAKQGAFEFREPDPASGILVSLIRGTGDGFHVHVLRAVNCRSTMEISAVFRTGTQPDEVTVTKDIHPDDEAAFQTLLDEVEVKGLHR